MTNCVVQIWFEQDEDVDAPRLRFHLCETEFSDFAEFLEAVAADDLICVMRLDTHWGEARGERVVHRRSPLAFRGRAVRRAELPTWRIVQIEEA